MGRVVGDRSCRDVARGPVGLRKDRWRRVLRRFSGGREPNRQAGIGTSGISFGDPDSGPTMAQDGVKMAQNKPKTAQDGHKVASRRAENTTCQLR